jgi:glucuronoarabinoxylan endo-1,4-beta-xylanase
MVIVAINTGSSSVSQTFSLQNVSGVTSLLANRTSSSENMAAVSTATVTSNTFTYTLPAQSVTTFHQF